MRPVDAPARPVAEIIRLTRGLREPVVLAGQWAAGEVVIAADPIFSVTGREGFTVVDQQPVITGMSAAGAVGGGWFGWLGFEGDTSAWGFYPHVLRYAQGQWWDEALTGLIDDADLERRRRQLVERLTASVTVSPYSLGRVASSRDRSEQVAAVERCQQHIRAGEIYQANICLTLRGHVEGCSLDLAADLIQTLEPPYGAYLRRAETEVASASPELFLRRSGRQLTSTPIKGTRPRTPETGPAKRRRLQASRKDRAENIMIVDLVRNDLSRVSEIGSVRVSRLLDVIAAPGVWHLESTITADRRAEATDSDLLAAAFPPGSVSGAPKARAVEIIAELEGQPRGIYTGAIGYASPVGGLELSVAIRTAQLTGGQLSLGVGGGVTVDSTPQQEWFECFDKARPLLASIGGLVHDPASVRQQPVARAEGGIYDTALLRFGVARERAEHVARLERSCYELYGIPLPPAAAAALLAPRRTEQEWLRQRIDVTAEGLVSVAATPVAAPLPIGRAPALDAVVLSAAAGFGAYKWADRGAQQELEARHPDHVVIMRDDEGLLETSRANVIAVMDGRLVTAPLDGRVLPGVSRTVLLDLARDLGIGIDLRAPDPRRASGIAIINSLIGLRWVRRCGELRWDEPDPLLRRLSERLVDRWCEHATLGRTRSTPAAAV